MTEAPRKDCDRHAPVQHRDGRPAWCRHCGLTAQGEQPASPLKSITLDGTIAHHADGSATWTATSGLEHWIKTVRGRLLAVKRLPIQEDREHEATFEAWSDLYEHAPTDLEIALEILNRLVQIAENHPDPCDEHPEGDVITCGWKNAYKSVIWALKGQDR